MNNKIQEKYLLSSIGTSNLLLTISKYWKFTKAEDSWKPNLGIGILDNAQTCLAREQVKRTWLIDSPSKLQTWHLESVIKPLEIILFATGIASHRLFQTNALIFGAVSMDHTCSFNPLIDGNISASWMKPALVSLKPSQYPYLTV